MKKPIFTEDQRRFWYNIEFDIALLKFKRDFEGTNFGKFMQKSATKLAQTLIRVLMIK